MRRRSFGIIGGGLFRNATPPPSVPAPAAAVGYNTLTFGSALKVGPSTDATANWYPFSFYGTTWGSITWTTNGDGSVTIPYYSGYGADLCSAFYTSSASSFHGIAFGGGAYFECSMTFPGPASFWANDIEAMNGKSAIGNTGGYQWTGQPTGYGNWIEVDFAEFDFNTPYYGFGVHNWYDGTTADGNLDTNSGITNGYNISGSPAYDPNSPSTSIVKSPNFGTYNTYGCLWVPATSTTAGYLEFYFNGALVSNRVTWNLFDPSKPPPPAWSNQTAFSIIDRLHLSLILGAGSPSDQTTNTVRWARVWQKSTANNIGSAPIY